MVPLGERSTAFAQAAQEAGLTLRQYGDDGVRATIGESEANDVLVRVAGEFLAMATERRHAQPVPRGWVPATGARSPRHLRCLARAGWLGRAASRPAYRAALVSARHHAIYLCCRVLRAFLSLAG